MGYILTSLKALPLLAVGTLGAASYPVIPQDKTTPVQQRLAVEGFNCMPQTIFQKQQCH
jgi:hypothetical protein